ncbi:MAG: cyclic nucleotide-binding domain-containing protein, partial [Rhodospirillaceae bacterium]
MEATEPRTPTDTANQVTQELRSHPTLRILDNGTIDAIASIATCETVPAGEMIIREGDDGTDFFLLMTGEAGAVREFEDGSAVTLNAMRAGDCFGELTFLDGGRRAASVRAETDCSVIRITAAALRSLPNAPAVTGELKGALASVAVSRVRAMSDEMLDGLRKQLEIKTIQNQFGQFLIFTIAIFMISTALFYLVAEDYVKDVYDPGFSWQAVLFLAAPCLLIIKLMKIPLEDLGIRREGLWRSLYESVGLCVLITIPALIYLFGFKPEATEGAASAMPGVKVDTLFLVQYLLHTIFQEVGSRGLLQGLFQKFLSDEKGHKAILITSLVFA